MYSKDELIKLKKQLYDEAKKQYEEGKISRLTYDASVKEYGEKIGNVETRSTNEGAGIGGQFEQKHIEGEKGTTPLPETTPVVEGQGFVQLNVGIDPGVNKFIVEDVKPGVNKVKEGLSFTYGIANSIKNALINIIEPAKLVEIKFGKKASRGLSHN